MLVVLAAMWFILWYTFDRGAHEIQPLVPALQSWWMKIHVPANFIGYGSFAIAAMIACAALLVDRGWLTQILPTPAVMDDLMYKVIALGFTFFTIATILGAMWAAEAWGGGKGGGALLSQKNWLGCSLWKGEGGLKGEGGGEGKEIKEI